MVSRKILIALGVFAVLAIGIGSVCAVQNIEVDGMKFCIPDEYKEDTSLATEGVTNEDGFKIYNRTYFDSSNKMIHISVFHGKDTDKLSLDDLKEPTVMMVYWIMIRMQDYTFLHILKMEKSV